ncbi:hypothetical protein A3K87_20975 [Variovorax paradoxus]|uniref:Xylose isomerase-like TIM barrel domain-containing protein n=1 Tax=Variovorax paradoxus TaxID=34073 RepID=A0AA91DN05_VARPD|nr:sugar phosphate isomerase/epimerase family protein [Variovorax paradoxus]OAK61406.1 hypothetical protein A3K87_20975 [Variovorax paradoxus]
MTTSVASPPAHSAAQPVLNLITVGTQRPFEKILDACGRHGITAVSPWRDHYADIGVQRAASALRERSISVSTLCRMTGFGPAEDASDWLKSIDDARRVVEEAATLGATSITLTGGGIAPLGKSIRDARQRILEGIQTILAEARAAGVLLAIEPLHPMCAADRGAISSIKLACEMAVAAGPGAKVMVDAYNTWWDPEIEASLAAAADLICGFQVSDWLVPTTDLAFDRGMMGDGVIDLPQVRRMVAAAGYDGPVEVEILSNRWAARPIDEIISTVMHRFASVC